MRYTLFKEIRRLDIYNILIDVWNLIDNALLERNWALCNRSDKSFSTQLKRQFSLKKKSFNWTICWNFFRILQTIF